MELDGNELYDSTGSTVKSIEDLTEYELYELLKEGEVK